MTMPYSFARIHFFSSESFPENNSSSMDINVFRDFSIISPGRRFSFIICDWNDKINGYKEGVLLTF